MIAQRLRQLRLARGLSLDELAAAIGGLVTKQSLSKYETGKSVPSPVVLNKLAATLDVKTSYLWTEPAVRIEFVGYRKGSRLPVKEQVRLESEVCEALERRIRLWQLVEVKAAVPVPVHSIPVRTLEDAEEAANQMRVHWLIGTDVIASVVGTLEDHQIHVIEVDAADCFDGISAVAYGGDNEVIATAVVCRRDVAGERQRFNLAHELGHLVIRPLDGVDEEKAAHRFAAAFLCPAATLRRQIGSSRAYIQAGEVQLLKRRFGLSIQALLHRLRDVGIITEGQYKQWCMNVGRMGWRRREPGEITVEKPQWLSQNVLRAVSEGLLSRVDGQNMLQQLAPLDQPITLTERRAFLKLPLASRRRILSEQAERIGDAYADGTPARAEIQGGDLVTFKAMQTGTRPDMDCQL